MASGDQTSLGTTVSHYVFQVYDMIGTMLLVLPDTRTYHWSRNNSVGPTDSGKVIFHASWALFGLFEN